MIDQKELENVHEAAIFFAIKFLRKYTIWTMRMRYSKVVLKTEINRVAILKPSDGEGVGWVKFNSWNDGKNGTGMVNEQWMPLFWHTYGRAPRLYPGLLVAYPAKVLCYVGRKSGAIWFPPEKAGCEHLRTTIWMDNIMWRIRMREGYVSPHLQLHFGKNARLSFRERQRPNIVNKRDF